MICTGRGWGISREGSAVMEEEEEEEMAVVVVVAVVEGVVQMAHFRSQQQLLLLLTMVVAARRMSRVFRPRGSMVLPLEVAPMCDIRHHPRQRLARGEGRSISGDKNNVGVAGGA